MDQELVHKAQFDIVSGMQRFGNNEKMYKKYLLKFLDDEHFNKGQIAYNNQDYDGILKAFHALKGVSGTLGLNGLFEICDSLVLAVREENFQLIPELMDKAVEINNVSIACIKKIME
jgi:HPt (histidine-containing phosphotransfer) domain-containing protein